MLILIIALIVSVILGFLFPAPLTLLAAGILQDNPDVLFEQTLGKSNLLHAYRFSAPFALVFALALAGFGFNQCRRTYRMPKHIWWHTGFLLLGGTFGASSLLAFQIAFGIELLAGVGHVFGVIALGAVAGALCALPVSLLWFFVVRRKVRLEREQEHDEHHPSPAPQH
jgi:hypothetical protein